MEPLPQRSEPPTIPSCHQRRVKTESLFLGKLESGVEDFLG
jgi:hypothetical protein